MSAKHVKRIILLVTVVLVSSSIILFNKITSPTPSASAIGVSSEVRLAVPGDTPSISQRTIGPVRRAISERTTRKIREIIGQFLKRESPIYMNVTLATSSKYEVELGYEKDCNGGTACRLGMISAEKLTETATEPPGSEASLETVIPGYFVDATCGANCSDATISWNLNGSRYTLGIKAGKKENLVKMADVNLRKLVKRLQELLTEREQGSLIERMGISDQLMGRSKTDERQSKTKTVAAMKDFQENQSLIAKGVVWNYRDALNKRSKQTLPKVRKYAVLRLSDGINYDSDEVVSDVRTLQNLLIEEGLLRPSELDGMFGPSTLEAVKEFQKSRGLVADGIVGSQTWSQLWNSPVEVYLPYDNLLSSLYLDEIIESIPPKLGLRDYAWDYVPLILWECDRSRVTDFGQIAYILATAEHESGLGKWMVELGRLCQYYEWRSDLGNNQRGDGCRYKGRGFVQITGRRNYTYWSRQLDIDLVNFPELAADPEIAAKILAIGMRDGTFTGHKLGQYIRGSRRDFEKARLIVNGDDRAGHIAEIASEYYRSL